MYRKKKEKVQSTVVHKVEASLNDNILSDIKVCFAYYDKNGRGEISRDNVKSVMENFGWLNRPVKEIEGCIESVFPNHDDKKKKEIFTLEEVVELITEYWIKKGYMENEFKELFGILDKK